MFPSTSFPQRLAAQLAVGVDLRIYHISTSTSPSPPLYAAAPGQDDEPTTCESHFLAVTQALGDHKDEVLALGIEVLVFLTASLVTVFVSKADSTGLLARQSTTSARRQKQSIAQVTFTAFLRYLVEQRISDTRPLVLSLFARSQSQYLFPGSIENSTKHVLDDRQLIKWWCSVINPLLQEDSDPSNAKWFTHGDVSAYLVVPGCDRAETRAFFPSSTRLASSDKVKWHNRFPVEDLVLDASLPARCLIPRLPDDPKARFCTDLDGDHIDAGGRWQTVRTLDQFWELMSYRQECSAGRLVGFIWTVFKADDSYTHRSVSATGSQPTLPATGTAVTAVSETSSQQPENSSKAIKSPSQTGFGRQDSDINEASLTCEKSTISNSAATEHTPTDPAASPNLLSMAPDATNAVAQAAQERLGHIDLANSAYEELMHLLIDDSDFAGLELAAKSSKEWLEKVRSFSGLATPGSTIVGCQAISVETAAAAIDRAGSRTEPHVLTAVRKKRKMETAVSEPTNGEPQAQLIHAGLLKKKPKA